MMRRKLKILAILLAAIMLASIPVFASELFNAAPEKKKAQAVAAGSDDRRIAGDVSNMTGVDIEEVLALKNSGKTWNEVLEELKGANFKTGSSIQRDNLLSQSSISKDELMEFKKEGYSDTELQQAKLLVERVAFQLRELTMDDTAAATVPEPGKTDSVTSDSIKIYQDIALQFDTKKCLYLTLKLKNDFGSMDNAIDEYLYSLQLGIDLALYIADIDEYNKQRKERSTGVNIQNIVTASKIEEKILEKLQKNNSSMDDIVKNNVSSSLKAEAQIQTPITTNDAIPDIPIPGPGYGNVNPENPADLIKNEINLIDPMRTGNGGIGK